MKQAIYILTLFLVFLSCNNKNVSNSEKEIFKSSDSLAILSKQITQLLQKIQSDSLIIQKQTTKSLQRTQVDLSTIECMPTTFRYGDSWSTFSPGTFEETTFLYNSMTSNAKIVDTLEFNSPVNILAEYPDFFLVCNQKGKSNYIKKTDLYFHSIFWGLKSNTYLFGISKYGTNDNISCMSSKLKVVKINDKKEIVTKYNDSILGKDYEIKLLHNSALKNVEALFYLSYHCYSGIGLEVDHFIVDNGKGLSRLVLASGSGDGGYSDISTVYLPVTLTNGKKIVLAKNGVLSIDETTAKAEIFTYPTDLKVPINELVVVQDKSLEMLDGYNDDGTMAEDITNIVTTFYQWNGMGIHKIKTVKEE